MMELLATVRKTDTGLHGMTEMTGLVLVTGRIELTINQKDDVHIAKYPHLLFKLDWSATNCLTKLVVTH